MNETICILCWIHTNLIIGKFNCRIFCSTRFGRVHRGGGGEFYNLVKRQNVVWHFHSQKSLTPIQRRHDASAQMFFEEVLLYLFRGTLFSIKKLNHIYFNFQVRFWFAYNSEILQIKLLWICIFISMGKQPDSIYYRNSTLSPQIVYFMGASKQSTILWMPFQIKGDCPKGSLLKITF